jgi:hypothetical protein
MSGARTAPVPRQPTGERPVKDPIRLTPTSHFVFVAALLGLGTTAQAAISGAIYTSLGNGTIVNKNIYDEKADVYLNGGPQNANAAGLPFDSPAGEVYYYQVTDPSGQTLLSEDDAICRQVWVAPSAVSGKGVISGPYQDPLDASNCAHDAGDFNPANGSIPVQLVPYSDTPNNGGEYKVWLIRQTDSTQAVGKVITFNNSDAKTDNFKVLESDEPPCDEPCDPEEEPDTYSIDGAKFYDTDADGVRDNGEPGIAYFQIELFGDAQSNTTTALNPLGAYSFAGLLGGTYGVCEVMPTGGQTWLNTTPTTIEDIVLPPNATGHDFGNVCLAGGNGRTLGFWSNKNGEARMKLAPGMTARLAGLSGLNLRNATGAHFDPGSYTAFRSWLLGANATNMAYMLSAQMSAMWLNVNVGGPDGAVPGAAMLYAGVPPANCSVPGLNGYGFVSVQDLISAADASLGANGNTTAGGPVRSCQEFMKNALDKGNNNQNFVGSPEQCTVVYGGAEPACSPPPPEGN